MPLVDNKISGNTNDLPTFPGRPSRIPKILSFVLAGLLTGALGTLLVFLFFPQLRQTYIPPGAQTVIVQQPGKIVVEESTKLGEIATNVSPAIVEVYRASSVIQVASQPVYLEKNRVGLGVLLTSDGWLAVTKQMNVLKGDVVFVDGAPYSLEQIVVDKASPFVLGKISGRSFPVVALGNVQAGYPGQTLVAIGSNGEAFRTSLWDKLASGTSGGSLASDVLEEGFLVHPHSSLAAGTPYFNLSGELLGLQSSPTENVITPSYGLKSLLEIFLSQKNTSRPTLGIRYQKIKDVNKQKIYALIYSDNSAGPAILPKSAASLANLKSGDIINSINGQEIDIINQSLFSKLSEFEIGDKISIGFNRAGQENKVEISLQ